MVFNPSDSVINQSKFQRRDWTSRELGHVEGKQELTPNIPQPRGLGFTFKVKANTYYTGDTMTIKSRTGFLCGAILLKYIGFLKDKIVWKVVGSFGS